ncbi:LysR family transcriptional regulator [Tahibacter amnicola]|uniref:LysR family transcriptional regulator n=1 Tax=Tahibacter amnicola TaxID=2976241 RepID=A0ABY6BLY2_9GAMM|nr:LysR family transcriptional regulator [Tahibacter amnicola]UXI70055.1 LysR family transcriptional regulator [Tahibacter amnicola]
MNETLSDIRVFVASADSGRLAGAARALGITPAAASAALKRLEASLGTQLILRSTRQLRLTQQGEDYLPHARAALQALGEGRLALAADSTQVEGTLRISAPADLGRNRLMSWLLPFSERHPRLRFQVTFDDAVADFFSSPVDVALRYGKLSDSSLIALPLATLTRVACAAPAYLLRHGTPPNPHALRDHAAICYMVHQRPADRWRFEQDGESVDVEVDPRWIFNDAEMVRRWAIEGHGVIYRIWADVAADIGAGRLQRILPDWAGETVPLSLVYTDRRLSPPLRLLIDEFRARRDELNAASVP